jgi:adenylate cyclase class 2
MPLEIEVKVKVEGHEGVRVRLREAGAVRHGAARETNVFFDRPDRSLRKKDTGLRVRFAVPLEGDAVGRITAPQTALLTVKGPAGVTGLRAREAFDLTVAPAEQMVPLLKMLGFVQVLLFEKDRESWGLDGCLVELDTMPVFGAFVEVEGPGEQAVRGVQEKLGLGDLMPHTASYSRMVGTYVEQEGITSRELRFAAM